MRTLSALLLACLACAASAEAPSPGRLQAAEELLRVMHLEQSTLAGVEAMVETQIRSDPTLAPYRNVILAWARRHMTWAAIGPQMAALYAERFTEPELRELIAFYNTPTGRKAVGLMGEILQSSAEIGRRIAQEHTPELERMLKERTAEMAGAEQR